MSDLKLVKELRDKTGAGFLDCKKALSENNNDLEASIDFLRKKGLSKASKKSSREAKEGVVGIYSNSSQTIILKVNSETDFAAKSETFLNFVDKIGNFEIKNSEHLSDNFITYDTVFRFKGLENDIIILTDIDETTNKNEIMYVATSRARLLLIVLSNQTVINNLKKYI